MLTDIADLGRCRLVELLLIREIPLLGKGRLHVRIPQAEDGPCEGVSGRRRHNTLGGGCGRGCSIKLLD